MKQLTLHLNDNTVVLALDAMELGRQTTILDRFVSEGGEDRVVIEELELKIRGEIVKGGLVPVALRNAEDLIEMGHKLHCGDRAMPAKGYRIDEKVSQLLDLLQKPEEDEGPGGGDNFLSVGQARKYIQDIATLLGCKDSLHAIALHLSEREKRISEANNLLAEKIEVLANLVGAPENRVTSVIETLTPMLARMRLLAELEGYTRTLMGRFPANAASRWPDAVHEAKMDVCRVLDQLAVDVETETRPMDPSEGVPAP